MRCCNAICEAAARPSSLSPSILFLSPPSEARPQQERTRRAKTAAASSSRPRRRATRWNKKRLPSCLTVRLLGAGTGAGTTELLGLDAARVGDEERAVVGEQNLLDLPLGLLVHELLVKGHQRLGDRLADGVDLAGVTTTLDAHPDVDLGEALLAEKQDGLVHLVTQHRRVHQLNGAAIDLDEAAATLAVGNGGGRPLAAKGLHAVDGALLSHFAIPPNKDTCGPM